jgi:hypothetical protein
MDATPLFYCTISTIPGICFNIGEQTLFAPADHESIHVVSATATVFITAKVPDLFARFLRETVIEKRLASLGGRP